METTVKTAEFNPMAADYEGMFKGLIAALPLIYIELPNGVEHAKTQIKQEISWAKSHLKKNDRIVWYLRWFRLALIKSVVGGSEKWKKELLDPELDRMNKLSGEDMNLSGLSIVRDFNELSRFKGRLEHFLSLPAQGIQDTIFDKQNPTELFTIFIGMEKEWKQEAKRRLTPHEEDKIFIQFADGWAWWLLGRGYCSEEAAAMGHCGNINGKFNTDERILSLRRPLKGGTAEHWEPFLTFILDGEGWLGEMKGRGNEKPAERYHKYITALLENKAIKGVKGGGYLPSHNFKLNDLDIEERKRLREINPNMVSAVDRLRELGGHPDNELIARIQRGGKVEGLYDPAVNGWVTERWENPSAYLAAEIHDSSIADAYSIFTDAPMPYEAGYDSNQIIRKFLMGLPENSLAVIQHWLEEQGVQIEEKSMHSGALNSRLWSTISQGTGMTAKDSMLHSDISVAARVKLWDAWKAGITPGMRADVGEQLEKALKNSYGEKSLWLTFDRNNFWDGGVVAYRPADIAAVMTDGVYNDEEDDPDFHPQDDEMDEARIDYNYIDPYESIYQVNRDTFEADERELKPPEREQVQKLRDDYYQGNKQPLIQWMKSVEPRLFAEVKEKAYDWTAASQAVQTEFSQYDVLGSRTSALTNIMFHKDSSFYIIAANYEEMFKNLLDLAKNWEAPDYSGRVKEEIVWAKATLKKQDRIIWWLRWFRFSLLGELRNDYEKAVTRTMGRVLDEESLLKQTDPNKVIPESNPKIQELKQLSHTISQYYEGELKALSARTAQPIHGSQTQNWFARMHHIFQHHLSLPIQKTQNEVWDKQTPEQLLGNFVHYEKEWQEQTKGLLEPHTEPEQNARPSEEVETLQDKVKELTGDLQRLRAKPNGYTVYEKLNAEGEPEAQSTRMTPGFVERKVTPQEVQEEIAEVEKELAAVTPELEAKNVPELDTVFIQFPDGWAWWKLSRAYCSEEAKAMGHCGNVVGQDKTDERILSLRQPKKAAGKAMWEPHLTFILEPNGYLGEMKGKGNAKPVSQYHPYIMKLLEDPRIKGIRGGGYLSSHNFALSDLTPEQQEEIIVKNPNMMAVVRKLKQFGATPEVIEHIEEVLWPDTEQGKLDYDPQQGGWVTEKWKSVDDLVDSKGNDQAKWVAKQMSGDGDFQDYADHMGAGDVLQNMNSEQELMLQRYLEVTYPEEVRDWLEENVDEELSDNLARFINDVDPGDVQNNLQRAAEDAARHGAEHEMHEALVKALKSFSLEDTGEKIKLPTFLNEKTGETGITWDSEVVAFLPIQAAAVLADRGEPFESYNEDNTRNEATIDVDQPHYGWSGWNEESFNETLGEEFDTQEFTAEKKKLDAKKKKELEAENKPLTLPDTSKWKVIVEKDADQFTDQRNVRVEDENGEALSWRSGTRDTDEEIIRDVAEDRAREQRNAKKKPSKKKKKRKASLLNPEMKLEASKTASVKFAGLHGKLEYHREGDVLQIDMFALNKGDRGQGGGRIAWQEFEGSIPTDIKLIHLFAADTGAGSSTGFWEKMGFTYKYDYETGDYESDNTMWKGVNGHATPESIREPENKEGAKVGKTPKALEGLAAEARKCNTFEEFREDFSHQIKHGRYYHVTSDPNFTVDPAKGPRDMSSMSGGRVDTGKLMITSHLDNWVNYYNYDKDEKKRVTRPYVAIIDMSEVPRNAYQQVSRGFGNEFFVSDPSKVRVTKIVTVAQAKVDDRTHHKALPHSDEELEQFYNQVKGIKTGATAQQPAAPVYFYIEVPRDAREHFWVEPPDGNLEFWAFTERPRCFYNQKIIFTFDKQPVAEAKVLKIEEPGNSICEETGKYEKHHKVFWSPKEFHKYKTAANNDPVITISAGTKLYRGVGEPEIHAPRVASDGCLWFTQSPTMARTYIPDSGITAFITLRALAAPPQKRDRVGDIQKQLGYEFTDIDYKNDIRAQSFRYPKIVNDLMKDIPYPKPEDFSLKGDEKYTHPEEYYKADADWHATQEERFKQWIKERLKEFGYEPDKNSGYRLKETMKDGKSVLLPADYQLPGTLLIFEPLQDLRIFDMTYGGSKDGDLMEPDYRQYETFKRLAEQGYDGVKINDFAQSESQGNVGHTAIGLFADALPKIKETERRDATHPKALWEDLKKYGATQTPRIQGEEAEKPEKPHIRGEEPPSPEPKSDMSGREPWEMTSDEYTGKFNEEETDDERSARYQKSRDWEQNALAALSLGKITPQQAKDWHIGDARVSEFKPLPPTLYHVTTNATAVTSGGLKTRQELLMQEGGTGLGGGTDKAISFTDDMGTAQAIRSAMLEAIRALNNTLTVEQMIDTATKGTGAARPWITELIQWGGSHFVSNKWEPGQPYPPHHQAFFEDKEIQMPGLGTADEEMPNAEPIGEGWLGGDGRRYHTTFKVPMTPERARDTRWDFFKTWLATREHANGPMNPLFFMTNQDALAKTPEREVQVLEFQPIPGAMGTRESALGEFRVYTGKAVKLVGVAA
jgi:hypothetical protein